MNHMVILFLLCLQAGFLHGQDTDRVREMYFTMDKAANQAQNMYLQLAKSDLNNNPTLLAYRGAFSAVSAGEAKGVVNKLNAFNRGKDEIEKAIQLKPTDIEIRFLRFATQLNAPRFLGYSGDIDNDKSLIIKSLMTEQPNGANVYLYQQICRFLLMHGKLSDEEANLVKKAGIKFNTKH